MSTYKVRSDFLRECMADVGQAPIDTFQKAFCVVCANRDCIRSSSNNLAFDRRILNWKQDLFDNVSRAEESDPRFSQIRSKRFLPAGQPPIVVSDTRVQEVPSVSVTNTENLNAAQDRIQTDSPINQIPEPIPEQIPEPIVHTQDSAEIQPQIVPTQPSVDPVPVDPASQSNTPFSQGATLPGFRKDEPLDIVIEPGASFTFGGGGNE